MANLSDVAEAVLVDPVRFSDMLSYIRKRMPEDGDEWEILRANLKRIQAEKDAIRQVALSAELCGVRYAGDAIKMASGLEIYEQAEARAGPFARVKTFFTGNPS